MSQTTTTTTLTSSSTKMNSKGGPVVSAPTPTSSKLLPAASQHYANGQLPNTPFAAAVIAAALGGLTAASLAYLSVPYLSALGSADWTWVRPQLGVYGAAMGTFHLMEFFTTAGWNPNKLSVDAFLLNNGVGYHAAHLGGIIEYLITSYFWPEKFNTFWNSPLYYIPVSALLIAGQALRSLAMIHASRSFSHVVKVIKHEDHTLITNGVYRFFRHPSYVGFFYWALSTQLLLGNVASTFAFAFVLGRFFYLRIIDEERHLVRFFGKDYLEYRKAVGTGLPFRIPIV